jgi:hypothetical protein
VAVKIDHEVEVQEYLVEKQLCAESLEKAGEVTPGGEQQARLHIDPSPVGQTKPWRGCEPA